jgi:hypothetical protein
VLTCVDMIVAVTAATRHRDVWLGLFWVGLACWTLGFAYHWFRVSLWLFDLVLIPGGWVLYSGGFTAMVYALIRRGVTARGVAVLASLGCVFLLVSPGYRVAPETYFAMHRPLFEVARHTDPGSEYYGNPLPFPLRFLTQMGNVSSVRTGDSPVSGSTARFFPQWIGIPDDAGGYLYSPGGSPEGADLYGSLCTDPVDLGDGWWMCNL